MGGSGSKLFSALSTSRITSKEELAEKTKDMTKMSDALFQFMYFNFNPNEVFDISMSPEKYVVALSELIQNQFAIIGYTTDRTVQGEIYFRKLEDLSWDKMGKTTPLNPRASAAEQVKTSEITERRKEHITNCNIISFFFVRIFQILGAMLIVIKDSNLVLPDEEGMPSNYINSREVERPALGYKLPKWVTYDSSSPVMKQRGGAAGNDEYLGVFEFLRTQLDAIDKTKNPISYKVSNVNLTLTFNNTKPVNLDPYDIKKINTDMKPQFTIELKNGENGSVKISRNIEITILGFNIGGSYVVDNELKNRLNTVEFRIKSDRDMYRNSEASKKIDDRENIIRVYKSGASDGRTVWMLRLDQAVDKIAYRGSFRAKNPGKQIDAKSVKRILENIFLQDLQKKEPGQNFVLYEDLEGVETNDYTSTNEKDRFSASGIKQKKIREIAEVLAGKKSLSTKQDFSRSNPYLVGKHCINRAVQLLNANAIMNNFSGTSGDIKTYTKICKFKVPVEAADVKNLYEYKPIKALSQLYGKLDIRPEKFEASKMVLRAFISSHSPLETFEPQESSLPVSELAKIDANEANSLKRTLDRLQAAFHTVKKASGVDKVEDLELTIPESCQGKEGKSIELKSPDDTQLINELRDVSRELLAYHVNKTIYITDFLKNMFNITQRANGTWEVKGINNSVLYAGFKGLDALTDQARELLVDYYEGCENIYQEKGVKNFNEKFKAADATPPPAPPAPPAPTAPPAPPAPIAPRAGGPP